MAEELTHAERSLLRLRALLVKGTVGRIKVSEVKAALAETRLSDDRLKLSV